MEATAEERRANGFCRYYIRGECREGNHCRFSHDSRDVPVCHYYQEGRCLFGKDCWYNHPDEQQFMPPVYPSLAVLDVGVVRPSSNLNLLLAAAVAGAQTDEDNSSSDEDDLEPLTLDKAMELWMKHKKPKENEAQKEENKNVDAESDDSSEEFGFLEKSVHEFFHELRRYDMTSWNVESVHKLISHLTDLHIKEFDDFNISLSMTLGEVIRLWRQESSQTAELFLRISEKDEADLSSLILTLCNAPVKVKFLEKHIASILTASQRKFPNEWRTEAIAKLLQNVEDNGFNIDATEVFHRMGKEFGDPEVLGKLVRDYLLTNAEKDSFSCRCNTAECECPAIVDEGIAFIVFAGLERKMNWDEEDKLKFFRCATDTLWTPEVLSELGELFNIKDAVNVCHPRVDKRLNWNAKEFVISEDAAGRDKAAQRKLYPQRKCRGLRCSNQPKRGCDFDMCGRCCKKIAEPCSVHEDFSVFEPPVFHGNYSLTKIEPRALFSSKTDLDHLISVTPFRSVTFGSDFSVHDDDVIKIVDLCKDSLVVLELGSSNTGAGVWLSDGAVQHIANYCPNLRKLRLESVTGVTDNAINDVMTKCPLLEELEVSGHDRSSGSLTDECIKRLFDLSVLPGLKGLIITDQMRVHHDVVYRLRRCRPNLKIIAGETDSDSFAHSMVLSMCGMSYGDGLY